MARNKAGHPLCRHERAADARELCTRWWCSYRLEIAFYGFCAVLIALVWWSHAKDVSWDIFRQASHSSCRADGQCWNDIGQTWHQRPGSLPLLGPGR